MDYRNFLRQLVGLRWWLATGALSAAAIVAGLALDFSASPLGVERKGIDIGIAQTTLYVDTNRSSLGDAKSPVALLAGRQTVYAQYATGSRVVDRATALLGSQAQRLSVRSGANSGRRPAGSATGASATSPAVIPPAGVTVVTVTGASSASLIGLTGTARQSSEAAKAVTAVGSALRAEVSGLQARENVPTRDRIALRRFGTPTVGSERIPDSLTTPVAGGAGVFLLFVMAGLLNLRVRLRRARDLGV